MSYIVMASSKRADSLCGTHRPHRMTRISHEAFLAKKCDKNGTLNVLAIRSCFTEQSSVYRQKASLPSTLQRFPFDTRRRCKWFSSSNTVSNDIVLGKLNRGTHTQTAQTILTHATLPCGCGPAAALYGAV